MNDFRPPKTTANNDNRKIDSIGTLKERRKRRTFTDILIAAANELPLHRQPEFIQNIVQLAKEGPEDDGEKLNKYIEENAQKYGSEENEKRWTGLHYLCNSKNVTPRAIQLYLEQCKDTITFYANFTTPLHLLCRNENVKKEHLNCYMQYETKGMTNMDEDLQTPLHYLCRATYCTVELIKSALLEYPDAGTFRGGTTVTTYVNREIEKLKSINEKNINNNSVENKVTRQASNSAMETLLSDRFYDEHSTVTGCTGLHYLCRNRIVSEKMLKEYLRYSKDAAYAQLVIEMWETGASNVVSKIFVLKWESESMMKATNTFLLITFIVFLVFTVNEVNALWDGHSRRVLSEIMDDPEAWEKLKLSEKPWYHSIFAKVIVTFCYCFTVKGLGDGKDLKDKTKQSVQKVTTATWQYIRGALSNPYLSDPWNYVELIIGSFFFRLYWFHTRVVILRSQAQIDVKNALDDPKSYIDLNDITESIFQRQDQLALTLIFVFLHGLKAIHRIPYLGIGFRTIAITRTIFSSDILPFYVVLLFLVSGFAFSFMFAFGDEVYGYHTFVDAIYNTLLTANGQDVRNMELIEGSHWSYAYVLIFFLIFFLALLLMNIFIAVVSEVYAKATETAFEDFHKMVDEEMMHEINHIKVHITTQITKKNITKHLNVKSTSTDMSLSTAIKKTIRNASISSVNRTKEKERSVGESSEETLRRVVPELLKRNAVVMKLKKLNDVQKS